MGCYYGWLTSRDGAEAGCYYGWLTSPDGAEVGCYYGWLTSPDGAEVGCDGWFMSPDSPIGFEKCPLRRDVVPA